MSEVAEMTELNKHYAALDAYRLGLVAQLPTLSEATPLVQELATKRPELALMLLMHMAAQVAEEACAMKLVLRDMPTVTELAELLETSIRRQLVPNKPE